MSDVANFEFGERLIAEGRNPFVPDLAYAKFVRDHGAVLTPDNVRIFFLRAYDAKQKLKTTTARTANLKFGTATFTVKNNHNERNANIEVEAEDLTLHRISGFLAKYTKESMVDENAADMIREKIVNPIAESLGISWDNGDDVYLSFFPGTEMFLDTFKMLPLAIGIYRVQQKQMKAEFLKKHLRQQYGGLPASQWMSIRKADVKNAVTLISSLPWGKAGLSAAARSFLADFGITL
ncbi:nucleocapsid protein [Orthobunyavirus guajaraense]|uniref:Nucleoprotein n=1 Tax=Orthobunyavirus guajaraense TaxID=3052395 RepID=A0A0R7FK68_9VIRU|nr:nucleocapsid protein [Orthobunyavirus guajaraense]AKO90189.1 nucleocapsid protein [Orthobunyavirus guajaraense]